MPYSPVTRARQVMSTAANAWRDNLATAVFRYRVIEPRPDPTTPPMLDALLALCEAALPYLLHLANDTDDANIDSDLPPPELVKLAAQLDVATATVRTASEYLTSYLADWRAGGEAAIADREAEAAERRERQAAHLRWLEGPTPDLSNNDYRGP